MRNPRLAHLLPGLLGLCLSTACMSGAPGGSSGPVSPPPPAAPPPGATSPPGSPAPGSPAPGSPGATPAPPATPSPTPTPTPGTAPPPAPAPPPTTTPPAPTPTPPAAGALALSLYNVVAQAPVADFDPITRGLPRVELPPQYTLSARAPAGTASVVFELAGMRTVDDAEPFLLTEAMGKPAAWKSGFGTFEVKVSAFAQTGGQGAPLAQHTQSVSVLATGMDPAFKPQTAEEQTAWIAANLERLMVRKSFPASNGQTMPYRLFTPPNHAPEVKYPLFVYLNGYGERGTDNGPRLYGGELFKGRQSIAAPNQQAEHPCFILIPQGSTQDEFWAWLGGDPALDRAIRTGGVMQDPKISRSAAAALELIDTLVKTSNIDPRRIYVGGLSTGGSGSLEWPQRRPDLFAAALPMAPWADWSKAGVAKETAFWFFAGTADTDTPPGNSTTMVMRMKEANVPVVRLSLYQGVGHVETMTRAGREPDIWTWTFAWIRKSPPAPAVP